MSNVCSPELSRAGSPALGWNEGVGTVLGLLLGWAVPALLLLLGFCPVQPRPVLAVALPLDHGLQLPPSK